MDKALAFRTLRGMVRYDMEFNCPLGRPSRYHGFIYLAHSAASYSLLILSTGMCFVIELNVIAFFIDLRGKGAYLGVC